MDLSKKSKNHIYLIGLPASGKTSVGQLLASDIGFRFNDIDDIIESSARMLGEEIFCRFGEHVFRAHERSALIKSSLSSERSVIATSSGTPLNSYNRKLMRYYGAIVYLSTSHDEIIKRLENSVKSDFKPNAAASIMVSGLFDDGIENILWAYREPYYRTLADMTVSTDRLTPHELALRIKSISS